MTTPEKPNDEPAQPTMHLMGPPFTVEKMAEMFRRLTGREPTPEGMEAFRKGCAEIDAKLAAKKAADEAAE